DITQKKLEIDTTALYNPHGSHDPAGVSPPGCQLLRMLYVCPQAIQLNPGSLCLHRRKLMESTKDTKLGGLQSTFSRRNLLKGARRLLPPRVCQKLLVDRQPARRPECRK